MPLELFDTHAHLEGDEFTADLPAVLQRARDAGVQNVIAIGCDAASSEGALAVAEAQEGVWAAVGIQPNYTAKVGADEWARIEQLATRPKVKALGETGLDCYWHDSPLDLQRDYFDRHLHLARRLDLPVVIHTRNSDEPTLEMLRVAAANGPIRGVMHSFTGAPETAAECASLGLFLSFAGMLTYKKSDALRAIAAQVPAGQLLIETDSPYLAPQAVRKIRRNEPAHVLYTAEVLADTRGVSLGEIAALTTANARRLFRIG